MKKMVIFMMLAIATLMISNVNAGHSHDSYGYFYLTESQEVDSGQWIDWDDADSFFDEEGTIRIDGSSTTKIIISNTGFYRVTWILTLDSDSGTADLGDIQFGLRFTDGGGFGLVPGSTYGVGNAIIGEAAQLNGQAVILVAHPNSRLALSNESEFDAALVAFEANPLNASASIRIERLADLD